MIELRRVESDADFDSWAAVKSAVEPDEPVTGQEMRETGKPERLLLLAEDGGDVVGSGIASPSSFPGACFVAPRVLPAARGRGVGASLLRALADHAAALGKDALIAHVDGADERSQRFAAGFGFEEIDRQVCQVREVRGSEPQAPPADGLELVSIAERPELLRAAYDRVAVEGYADLALPTPIEVPLDEWLEEEATLPEASFVALADGEPVGYAGLLRVAATPGVAEHGLTAVRRDHRRRGVATALKRAQIRWAASSGLRELVTWTQRGNADMQGLNERLGYVVTAEELTLRAELPLV